MNNIDSEKVWGSVLDKLRNYAGDDFELWLKPLVPLGLEDRLFKIRTPNKFFTKYIKDHYQSRIESMLKELSGADLALDYSEDTDLSRMLPKADPIDDTQSQSQFTLSELNPKYTFGTFVVGASNRFAQATAEAVAKDPGRQFNPFFIYGGTGLGKTHLMQAIGHAIRRSRPRARVLYTHTEQFVNEFIDHLRDNKNDVFRSKYRNLDCFLIDDVQFLIGKGRSEEEFFYTFNSLFESRKQVVIASDRTPKELGPLDPRLIGRLEWGVVSDIKPPDLETRIAILRKKAEAEQIFVPDDVILYIATVIKSNIRELEGALISLKALSAVTGSALSVDAAKELLKGSIGIDEDVTVRIETIQRQVAEKYSIDVKDMKSRSRRSEIAFPRQLAMYLSCRLTESSTTEIGRAFGGRDHTTVLHARKKIQKMMDTDPFFLENTNKLIERIRSVDNL